MERIEMSQEERDRLEWLKRAQDNVISQREAAKGMKSERPVGTQAIEADEARGRPCGGAWIAGASLEPQDHRESASPSDGDTQAARLARFWTDLRRRTVGQAA